RHRVAEKFKASGKKSLVLFILSDCDPAGDMIAESTVHSLRDEFGIKGDVRAIRVAMTHAQAEKYGTVDSIDAKESNLLARFIERHGRNDCYELEAVAPGILQDLLHNEIRANIDVEAYNAEVDAQAKDVAKVRAVRKAILEIIRTSPEIDLEGDA